MDLYFTLDELPQVARTLLDTAGESRVWAMHGEMGVGKTTLAEEISRQAGVTDAMSSPTFSIIHTYDLPAGGSVYHIDLYRLDGEAEAIRAGVEDCFDSGDLCLVEWPEKAPGLFPPDTWHIYLERTGQDQRRLRINP